MNIIIIEDHFISAVGIEELLKENFSAVKVFHSKHQDVNLKTASLPSADLIILSLGVDDEINLQTWQHISDLEIVVPAIVYCSRIKYHNLIRFLTDGAKGILFKDQESNDFVKCVEAVMNGERYICHEALVMIANQVISGKDKFKKLLSVKELHVARQLVTGRGTTDIAKNLNLPMSAVSIAKGKIFDKLGIKNILELREIINSGALLQQV